MPKFKDVKVSLKFPPFIDVTGSWEPDENERKAAWELYVELVTRIAIVELKPDEGLLREALTSIYTLFNTTREILKKYGPSVAKQKGSSKLSFGSIAVEVLNGVLRPVLAYWHPKLLDYENTKGVAVSALQHEKRWECAEELRDVLNTIRPIMLAYATTLAEVAEVAPLVFDERAAELTRREVKKCDEHK